MKIKKRLLHLALLNGVKTVAKKYGTRWMVGGDFDTKGSVSIAALHKDVENGGSFWAWHKLRGCFLVFEDLMSDDEIAEQISLNEAEA